MFYNKDNKIIRADELDLELSSFDWLEDLKTALLIYSNVQGAEDERVIWRIIDSVGQLASKSVNQYPIHGIESRTGRGFKLVIKDRKL